MNRQQQNNNDNNAEGGGQPNEEAAGEQKEEDQLGGEEPRAEEGKEDDLNNSDMSGMTPSRPILPGCEYTEQEENWAWEIVGAIEGQHNSDISICSDFEYMQLAIYAQGDVEKALRSARGMQLFRETYNVQDTVEECMDMIQQFIALQPGALLHLDILDSQHGEGLAVWDQGAMVPSRSNTDAKFRATIMAVYYISTIVLPDFRAIREGLYYLCEGKDMGWHNLDAEFEYRLHQELWMHIPHKFKRIMIYNTNSIVNMWWGLAIRFMRPQIRDSVELGCQIELDENPENPKLSLSDLYLLPDYNTAMQHCLQRARILAEGRFRNQEEFRL